MKGHKGPSVSEIIYVKEGEKHELPLYLSPISAGFPSPADDYVDQSLDLNEYLIKRPAATFFVRVKGDSMTGAGIQDGDILIVDRSLEPTDNKVVIAAMDGEFTVKRILRKGEKLYLMPDNPDYDPVELHSETDFTIWGVVTYVIHAV
ncbi:MAG: translesion error-prone DNA polymerase V autoproteolytic subunit [Spirochaetota bacterium]|nr:translesion error-prone DNA polymerase V autoproteolytic subunit [Spirochaetota bacterium]